MNSPLEEYLKYYKTCKNPGYAVLITGEWGVGKTFQVKQALKDNERYYVSLFGLKTASEIHSEIYAAVYPTTGKIDAATKKLGETAKDIGGLFAIGGLLPGLVNSVFRKSIKIDRILIFDDLERCLLEQKEILGIINAYVEHLGCNVIVIANENEIPKFDKTKEKLFGQTIKIEPQIEEAFEKFCGDISNQENQSFVKKHKENIVGIFKESGENSLRILRHVIEDLARLRGNLTKLHASNSEAMIELVQFFSALDIETRAGNLTGEDLEKRLGMGIFYRLSSQSDNNGDVAKPPLIVADEKYKTIDLENDLLRDEVLVQMLVEGRYDTKSIQNSLDNHLYFLKPEDAPPWKIIYNFRESDDESLDIARDKMAQQFKNRDVLNSGEMLHIFSLRMMMSHQDILNSTVEDEANAAKKYIKDILSSGKLPPRETDWDWKEKFISSYDGYGYWQIEEWNALFGEVVENLIQAREMALDNQLKDKVPDFINLVKTDGRAFLEQFCHTNNGENPYALVPVLHLISAEDFVDAWLGSAKGNWPTISMTLRLRYDGAQLENELSIEKNWVREVIKLLKEKSASADGFQSMRIDSIIPSNLKDMAD